MFKKLKALNKGSEYWYSLSSGTTPREFKSWATKHSNVLKKMLREFGFSEFKVSKSHFYYTMFAYNGRQWIYLSSGDVRLDDVIILIRTAESDKDYTGGSNCFIDTETEDRFKYDVADFMDQIG
jgi:hypothetical protein